MTEKATSLLSVNLFRHLVLSYASVRMLPELTTFCHVRLLLWKL